MTVEKKWAPRAVAVAAALAALQIGAARAQTAPAPAKPPAPAAAAPAQQDALSLDEIVITASPEGRSKMKQSLSISTIDGEQILKAVPASSAEILRSIPGVRAEASSGEGNANVTVRGVPISAGGSRYVQFQEDGLPVLLIGDFNFVTPDMFIRADLGTDGLEVVRGGSASTLGTNSPGGVINFLGRTGEEKGGSVAFTSGLNYKQQRVDFEYGAPLSDRTRFHVSGFYRGGEGTRDTAGLKLEQGGQLRANLTHDLGGGSFVRLNAKVLDDKTPTLLTVPVRIAGQTISELRGLDPRTAILYSPKLQPVPSFGLRGDGPADINDALQVKSTAIGAEANLNLGNGWVLNDKFRISNNTGSFYGVMPASDADAAGATYGALFLGAKFKDIGLSVNDLKLSKAFALQGDAKVNTTLGLFMARQKLDFDWEIGGFPYEVAENNAAQLGPYTSFYKRYVNASYNSLAPYAAVSWESGPWNVDGSVRFDRQRVTGSYEANGQPTPGARGLDYRSDFTGKSLGVNYRVNPDTAVFARVSQGASFNSDRVLFNEAAACDRSCFVGINVPVNEVTQYEGGVKWRSGNFSTFVTVFQAKTDETNFDLTTGRSSADSYDAKGVEIEAGWRSGGFRVSGGVTVTDAKITASNTAAMVGLTPNRQARVIYQVSPSYRFGAATVGASIIGTTKSRDAQGSPYHAELPAYATVNAFANYEINPKTVVSLGVNNLFNTLGYTEVNNERAAARSITGRTIKASLKYSF